MTSDEADNHLYVLGVPNDARGRQLLLLGGYGGSAVVLEARAKHWGARVYYGEEQWRETSDGSGTVDYVLAVDPVDLPLELIREALKPEGKYVILYQSNQAAESDPQLLATNCEFLGGASGVVRVSGVRPRKASE